MVEGPEIPGGAELEIDVLTLEGGDDLQTTVTQPDGDVIAIVDVGESSDGEDWYIDRWEACA